MPSTSVVIPVKNGGTDLVRCLEAIGRQRVEGEVEIVVVDSGSTDGSSERARRLGAQVHEIAPDEFHHGRTRNLGASLARGDVLHPPLFQRIDLLLIYMHRADRGGRRRGRVVAPWQGRVNRHRRRRGRRAGRLDDHRHLRQLVRHEIGIDLPDLNVSSELDR
jgi:glycosyltransferase involved in cell wall biosynthesis